jgi:hypothetical protein
LVLGILIVSYVIIGQIAGPSAPPPPSPSATQR